MTKQTVQDDQAAKNKQAVDSVTNQESKAIVDRITELNKAVQNMDSDNKAFIIIAAFDAGEKPGKSISTAGVVGNNDVLVRLLVEAMEQSDDMRSLILASATTYSIFAKVGLNRDEESKKKEPFTYTNN